MLWHISYGNSIVLVLLYTHRKRSMATLQNIYSIFLVFFFIFITGPIIEAIPAKYDGFVYKNRIASTDKVMIEAFFDPVCPDSRDAWPPLKQAFEYYGDDYVSLILHTFPLPYHDNAFVTSRALHIVNNVSSSATFNLLEMFFHHQEKFYNARTLNVSKASVVDQVTKFATKAIGKSHYSSIQSGFLDRQTDLATRSSFKYGCSRGVYGTPFFFVNGYALPDGGSAIDYNKWRNVLDPLVGNNKA